MKEGSAVITTVIKNSYKNAWDNCVYGVVNNGLPSKGKAYSLERERERERGLFVGLVLFNIFIITLDKGTKSMFIKYAAPIKTRQTPCTLEGRSRIHSHLEKLKENLKLNR